MACGGIELTQYKATRNGDVGIVTSDGVSIVSQTPRNAKAKAIGHAGASLKHAA